MINTINPISSSDSEEESTVGRASEELPAGRQLLPILAVVVPCNDSVPNPDTSSASSRRSGKISVTP